ncbi:STAS/SEC14 domain-containing protein [Chitinophaga sp.]|uniref:STAS/SEC14 domain-containing protein n=1 Tax=Chitinophaga sp. TaxID=1869181 RepID=UPI0031D03059
MVELLADFPPHVAAYKASGAVSKEEYRDVVMRRVDEVAGKYGQINFLVRLETDMGNYSIGAFLEYLKVSFEHFFKWQRMAIVTDESWLRKAYSMLSPLVHGEIRTYPLRDFEAARTWVSGPFAN